MSLMSNISPNTLRLAALALMNLGANDEVIKKVAISYEHDGKLMHNGLPLCGSTFNPVHYPHDFCKMLSVLPHIYLAVHKEGGKLQYFSKLDMKIITFTHSTPIEKACQASIMVAMRECVTGCVAKYGQWLEENPHEF